MPRARGRWRRSSSLATIGASACGAAGAPSGPALADRIEEKLPHIQAPTLVVRGARDPLVPSRWAEGGHALLPHGRLVVLPARPTPPNFSAPDALLRAVLPFLYTREA